jgi:hypothetical protein
MGDPIRRPADLVVVGAETFDYDRRFRRKPSTMVDGFAGNPRLSSGHTPMLAATEHTFHALNPGWNGRRPDTGVRREEYLDSNTVQPPRRSGWVARVTLLPDGHLPRLRGVL